jgi:superfamily I DNA and/or RNA helicase
MPIEEDHFQRLLRLLDLESHAEAQEALRRRQGLAREEAEKGGDTLLDLVVVDEHAGLGGRYLVGLAKPNRKPLPWTRLGVGSPVFLSPDAGTNHGRGHPTAEKEQRSSDRRRAEEAGYRGVVSQRDERVLQVAISRLPSRLADFDRWRVDLSDDETATARSRDALRQAADARGNRLAHLREVLLGRREAEFGRDPDVRPLDAGLNAVQVAAVQHALSARDVALIHGPPGTGKTTVVVELIRQAVRRGQKVLVSAPSNLGVDNVFEKLLAFRERAVRLGHPARVLPELRAHTLDLLVEKHQDARLADRLVKQAMSLFREADRFTRAKPQPGAKRQLRDDARSLLADARRLESQAVESILTTADVLCSTTTGLDWQLLGRRRFDLLVIDEACQSTEPGCWIPLLGCDRIVLAGDHCQLPPTVLSRDAEGQGFGISLFERLVAMDTTLSRRLTVQYRMHRAIMDFSSHEFYDGELEADRSVVGHVLADLPGVGVGQAGKPDMQPGVRQASQPDTQPGASQAGKPDLREPVEFIDTAGAGFDEQLEPGGESRLNPGETEFVCRRVRGLLGAGVSPRDIAVISPYAAQVRLLREQLAVEGLEIDSVDGFQGREKEAVVLSLVRSNPRGEIGFLGDVRRMNVAMTRARRKLLVVGDSATLAAHPFYRRLLDYFERIGAYRTVWEHPFNS